VNGVVSTVQLVLPALATMASRAEELEEIEQSIELIALNSAITTAHLGKEGACMAVIASELQSITRNSEEETRVVLDCLAAVDAAVQVMTSGRNSDTAEFSSYEVAGAKQQLQRLADSTKQANTALSGKLNELLDVTKHLRSELLLNCELANQGGSIADAFEQAIANADLTLQQLGHNADISVNSDLAKLSALYSMDAERQIHDEVAGVAAVSLAGETGEFGDGIELF